MLNQFFIRRNKMQININDKDINRLATGRDIGKLVAFTDNPDSYVTYGILEEVNLTEDSPYLRKGDYSHWKFARTLNDSEIRSLL
jgi:hypothetical protein